VALASKSGAGVDPGPYCQGLTGCSAKIRSTEDTDIWPAVPGLVISAASSGPVQRASGTPVAARQLAGQRDHGRPGQLADPPGPPGPGPVLQPAQAVQREPAPPLTRGALADAQVSGDGPAAGRGQYDLRPQPVPPGGSGAADPFLQRLALSGGQRDGHGPRKRHRHSKTEHTEVIRSWARDHNQRGCRRAAG